MKFHRNNLFDEGKVDKKTVNIFRRHSNRITFCLPTHYKTYCFAFQKRRFCTVKVAVLRCKTYAFATPNRNYHFSYELSLQNYSFNVGVQLFVFLISVLLFFSVRNVLNHVPTC